MSENRKYKEYNYNTTDLSKRLIDNMSSLYEFICKNNDDFFITFLYKPTLTYSKTEEILLHWKSLDALLNIKMDIAHLVENDVNDVAVNIKRKREKRSTGIKLRSIKLESKIYQSKDYWYPTITENLSIKFDTYFWSKDVDDEKYIECVDNFTKKLSKNRKKDLVKFFNLWENKKNIYTAKSFFNMLTEKFNMTFSLQTSYFVEKGEKSSRKWSGDHMDVSINFNTLEHYNMVKKGIKTEEKRVSKMKKLADDVRNLLNFK